ncbi:ankyrin repeat and protein kinase domain-containing protein 1-like [Mercenaria mercenaria]|uniref:ankyrin repeat and protein kinase domain-containing protein 1-like n=1 Tax=Mercenaria mercenaria TaxID=6596 RepID=UPI00234E8A4B|nr:ankyrin repeat and protein kinase domain-containing protein 1-like [Mercenaria mercenaria]
MMTIEQELQENSEKPSWWTPLCEAIKEGTLVNVKKILQKYQFPDLKIIGETVLSESPLHLAVIDGRADIVDLLLSHGIDVTTTNLYGETPLHVACRTGNTAVVKKLLDAGSLLEYKDSGECTPLFHAIYGNRPAVTELLIKVGSDLDSLNEELMSPLDHAVLYNQSEIITLLLKGGCALDKTVGQVYYPGHYSNSILFSLWSNGDIASVKILLQAGYQLTASHLTTLFRVAQQLEWDDSLLKAAECMIREPATLKDCSRIAIRRHLMSIKYIKRKSVQRMIENLPLPDILRDFVSMM